MFDNNLLFMKQTEKYRYVKNFLTTQEIDQLTNFCSTKPFDYTPMKSHMDKSEWIFNLSVTNSKSFPWDEHEIPKTIAIKLREQLDAFFEDVFLIDPIDYVLKGKVLRYEEGAFFASHRDTYPKSITGRLITFSIGLTDQYQGGELIFNNQEILIKKGDCIFFNSGTLHSINHVTQGCRLAFAGTARLV